MSKGSSLNKRLISAVLALAVSTGSLIAGAPAFAAPVVPNASFETGWSGSKLKCWNLDGSGSGKLTVTRTGHTGQAAYVDGKGRKGTRLKLMTDRTDSCRVAVTPGQWYTMQFWLKSTNGVQPVVYTKSGSAGWVRWYTGTKVGKGGPLRSYAVKLPAIPGGVTAVSVGVAFAGTSTVVLDDLQLTQPVPTQPKPTQPTPTPTRPTPSPTPSPRPPTSGQLLFGPSFPSTDRLITNEFSYWSPKNPNRTISNDWEMTSGSLFARGGNGYSGAVNNVEADALSRRGTNSAVFRLTTRQKSFGNVLVQMNLDVERLSSTSTTPRVDWDGVHIFLRYKSEFELYYASVARRDGKVVIKKKCRGGPINGGRYYAISPEDRGQPIAYGDWMKVGASVRTNANGSVTIVLFRNGKEVVSATDSGFGCAPITQPGATGIRADNALFQFNTFRVTGLG
jgi:hypothetical protein